MWAEPALWLPAIAAFVAMEFWSMWVHRKLWHGPLWWGHRSHHAPRIGPFERNDAFAWVHAAIAGPMVYFGLRDGHAVLLGIGGGMTAFGLCYAVVHDGLVHGRLPVAALARIPALRRIRNAHLAHHQGAHRPPYGLFLGPWELRRYADKRRASRVAGPSSQPGNPRSA